MLSITELFLRLLLSSVLGAIIGYERESAHKAAGLRTHMIVCIGSALITLVSMYGFGSGDPTRIAASIITGIGFLGAGTIMVSKGGISGLTTAATLWIVAGVGIGIGTGYYAGTFITSILVLTILELNRFFDVK